MEKIPGEGNDHYPSFAWRIPWTEEPRQLQSMGLKESGHDGVWLSIMEPAEIHVKKNQILLHDGGNGKATVQKAHWMVEVRKDLSWLIYVSTIKKKKEKEETQGTQCKRKEEMVKIMKKIMKLSLTKFQDIRSIEIHAKINHICMCVLSQFSHVLFFATQWTVVPCHTMYSA